jgi:nicotinamidase-related amidase
VKEIYGKSVCETLEEVLHPDRCTLIVIDMQNDLVLPEGKVARAGLDVSAMVAILPRCQEFIGAARELGVDVVHVQTVTLREGRSDSPSWIRAKGTMVGEAEFTLEGTWGAEICPECAPLPGEPIVTKHRSSAFRATDLDTILRSLGTETVVIIGEQTPGCVEATYRDAAYHDYYNVLVEDCVAAYDPELHDASLKVQRARHDVCTAEEVLSVWRRERGVADPIGAAASAPTPV